MKRARQSVRKTDANPERLTEPVRLKPLFGAPPTKWVPMAYGAALLLALVVFLLLPGIFRHGSRLTIRSLPPGAAVVIDGTLIGATPVETFVKSGDRNIQVSAPLYSREQIVTEVPGRLFASLFLPRKESLTVVLETDTPSLVLSEAMSRYTDWAYIGGSNSQYQFPAVLTESVEGLASRGAAVDSADLLRRGALDVNGDAPAKDLVAASFRADAGAGILTAASATATITALAQLTAANPRLHHLADRTSDGAARRRIIESHWYADRVATETTALLPHTREGDVAPPAPGQSIEVAGLSFHPIPAAVFVMGSSAESSATDATRAHPIRVSDFYVGRTEITRGQYLAFVEEMPEWGLDSRAHLTQSGLVSERYLQDWIDDPPAPNDRFPVVHVSAHAAEAFAAWLTEKLADRLPGYVARLPYEAEWEWAAEYAAADAYPSVFLESQRRGPATVASRTEGPLPIYDISGNVWEWTANVFHPASYLVEPPQHAPGPRIGPEAAYARRAVRGGSWANLPGTVTASTRGSQPPWWCTPYLGFRVVLVPH